MKKNKKLFLTNKGFRCKKEKNKNDFLDRYISDFNFEFMPLEIIEEKEKIDELAAERIINGSFCFNKL